MEVAQWDGWGSGANIPSLLKAYYLISDRSLGSRKVKVLKKQIIKISRFELNCEIIILWGKVLK